MNPVPYTQKITRNYPRDFMTEDQRFASMRPDVLVYQTDALSADVTAAGPVTVSLVASTSGSDSDFVVKLIDVYSNDAPDNDPNPSGMKMGGYEMLVRGEPMRARFRKSFETPEPMVPNKPDKIEYVMPDVNHTFKKGHRIMVQVQSTWFPLVDRNPQKFVNIYKASDSDFQKAIQRVYHSSRVILNVLK